MTTLAIFLQKAKDDPLIGSVHISLYVARFHGHKPGQTFRVNRPTIMQLSKLISRSAYYQALSVLPPPATSNTPLTTPPAAPPSASFPFLYQSLLKTILLQSNLPVRHH